MLINKLIAKLINKDVMNISVKPYVLALSLLFPLVSLAAPEVKVFKNWAVACNNQQQCEASSLLFKDDFSFGNPFSASIKITRGAALKDHPFIDIQYGWETTPTFKVGEAIVLEAGKERLLLGNIVEKRQYKIDIPSDKTTAFLSLVRNPSTLVIQIGDHSFTASLKGLSATVLYIDEQQKRLETASALIRKGNKVMLQPVKTATIKGVKAPNGMMSPTDVIDKIRPLVSSDLKALCDSDEEIKVMDFAEVLDKDHYLVGFTCSLAAYNASSVLFKVEVSTLESDKPEVSLLKVAALGEETAEVFGASFENGILTSFQKGRGIGDCGEAAEWVWTGKQFKLVAKNIMPVCRGASDFLNVWRLNYQFDTNKQVK